MHDINGKHAQYNVQHDKMQFRLAHKMYHP